MVWRIVSKKSFTTTTGARSGPVVGGWLFVVRHSSIWDWRVVDRRSQMRVWQRPKGKREEKRKKRKKKTLSPPFF